MNPGIYAIDATVYHADPCPEPSLSASIIGKLIDQSPLHAKSAHPRLTEQPTTEESTIMDIGSIAHSLLLEGIDKAVVLDFDNYKTKAAQTARDEARMAGLYPILRDKYADVDEMIVAARRQIATNSQASNMFRKGKPEQTLIWQESGVWCRARLDWLHDDHRFIDDYKTTSADGNPEATTRGMFGKGWDVQAAWYLRGLKAITSTDAQFRFAVQETYRPFALSVIAPGPAVLMLAEKKILYALDIWRECLTSGNWPAYPQRICYAELPEWVENAWLKRETESMEVGHGR